MGTCSEVAGSHVGQLDPRLYQLGILGCLLGYGIIWFYFDISAMNAVASYPAVPAWREVVDH